MKTKPKHQSNLGTVRIEARLRSKLRKHCQQRGLIMGAVVSQLVQRYLDGPDMADISGSMTPVLSSDLARLIKP